MKHHINLSERLYEVATHCPACLNELLVVSSQPIEVTALHFCSDCKAQMREIQEAARRLQRKPGINRRGIVFGLLLCSVFWGLVAWWWLR